MSSFIARLGPVHLTMIGVGATIGAGIFVIAGTVSAEHAGPAVLLSFLIAATGCFFAALCYAELAAMIPQAGSAYTYTYATMGRSMAWFIGWNMVLEFGVSASTVAAGWSGYFLSLLHGFGIDYPAAWANAPFAGAGISDLHWTGAVMNLPAFLIMLVITAILVVGISESARFNAVMVVVKVGIVAVVILFGLPHVHMANLHPFIPPNTGVWGHFGPSGVLAASGTVFFAYVGFETVSVAAQETRNPERDVSISILAALAVCTLLYVLMSVVLIGIIDYHLLDVADPVSFALEHNPELTWLVFPVNIAAIAGLISVAFGSMYGQSRVFYGMARDGFLPPAFAKVHPAIPHAAPLHHHHRRGRRDDCGRIPARSPGRSGFDRHAACLYFRLRRHSDPAQDRAQDATQIPHPLGMVRGARRNCHLRRHDVQPLQRHLDTVGGLDRDRFSHLLRLRHPACRAVEMVRD